MPPSTPIPARHAKKHKRLTLKEKIDVVHAVLVRHEKHADVAKEYRVRPNLIA